VFGVLHVVQVGPEVAKQLFDEHIERLKAREKDRKHKDDDEDGGGKKKKRSSRWVRTVGRRTVMCVGWMVFSCACAASCSTLPPPPVMIAVTHRFV
jgi:hypothetical protein